jgi:hypothetical protein
VSGFSVLDWSYQALLRVISALDDDAGWQNTRCAGWTVRDLVHHLLADAQRALVALHTPAPGPPDADSMSYWRPWQPGTPGAEAGRRGTRDHGQCVVERRADRHVLRGKASAVLVAGRERAR